jgi:hypothetical protein
MIRIETYLQKLLGFSGRIKVKQHTPGEISARNLIHTPQKSNQNDKKPWK